MPTRFIALSMCAAVRYSHFFHSGCREQIRSQSDYIEFDWLLAISTVTSPHFRRSSGAFSASGMNPRQRVAACARPIEDPVSVAGEAGVEDVEDEECPKR